MTASKTRGRPPALPGILLSRADFDALDRLVGDLPGTGPAGLLQQELDRAEVCDDVDMPRDVVGLNRWLHYADDRHPEVRRVQLVLPREADIDAGRVSILSHVGAGLIGLKEGESINWPDPSGETRKLTAVLIEDEDPIAAVAH
ncbi:GreA/GreB family elongation factor [uncultured Brevundimonas sp.]|uniref:GreA/GreB family elongation factor n=1 Tax=Brevundimonas sp. CEF1 TaxID=3442642 RepID=UPI0025FA5BFE|nr:GreA/GreB family elongation factor [uncultured Brevundimonas sp.]